MSGLDSHRLVHQSLIGEGMEGIRDVAVFVWDDERRYVAVNDAACRITGLSREALIGMPVGGMTADRAADTVEQVRQVPLLTGTTTFTRGDGIDVELEFVTAHTRIAGLPFMVSVCWQRP
ncbi:MAG TPA: PAS domain-containing protein [Gaiellaceae bacterium]